MSTLRSSRMRASILAASCRPVLDWVLSSSPCTFFSRSATNWEQMMVLSERDRKQESDVGGKTKVWTEKGERLEHDRVKD